jgi:predicted RNase H-like HicB family nuclease
MEIRAPPRASLVDLLGRLLCACAHLRRRALLQDNRTIGLKKVRGYMMDKNYKGRSLHFRIEFEQETDGRWIADVTDLGVLVYGDTKEEAIRNARNAVAFHLECLAKEHDFELLEAV